MKANIIEQIEKLKMNLKDYLNTGYVYNIT